MQTRRIEKRDFDEIVSVIDRWWGAPAGTLAHPIFFYELGQRSLIAEEDGLMMGFLLGFLTPNSPPTGYVHLVGIHPEHRRRGVGRFLYEAFTNECITAGCARMKAIAPTGNEASASFHSGVGWNVEEVADYAGPGRARLVFTRDLKKEMSITEKELGAAIIFAEVPEAALVALLSRIEEIRLNPGAIVFREGDAGMDLFVVIDGEVEVGKKSRSGRETRIAILGPGDSFGEMSMIEAAPRSATIRTLGPTRLARIPIKAIESLAEETPIAYGILLRSVARNLAKRLRTTDGVLADIAANVYAHYPNR